MSTAVDLHTVTNLLADDIAKDGILSIAKLDRYRKVLGSPGLLRELFNNRILSNMPEVYKRYMLDTMLPTSLSLLSSIGYVWTRDELNEYLTCESWIIKCPKSYDNTLKFIFKDNSIMLNKWVRYAEGVRSL